MPNNTIDDIKVINRLSECDAATIPKIKDHVRKIRIDTEGLLQSDQITLATMIKQLGPLDEVFVEEFLLDPPLIHHLKDCPGQVKTFKAGYKVMESVTSDEFPHLMKLFDSSKIEYLQLRCADNIKVMFLEEWINRGEIDFDNLGFLNVNRPDFIKNLFAFLEIFPLGLLLLNIRWNLTRADILEMSSCKKMKKVQELCLQDKSLDADKFDMYLTLYREIGCQELYFRECNLTKKKIALFTEQCKMVNVEMKKLVIFDNLIPAEALRELSSALHVTQCKQVVLWNCKLTSEKFSEFGNGCLEKGVALTKLTIFDNSMAENAFREFSKTLKNTQCKEVGFDCCNLNRKKLSEFVSGCQEYNLSLEMITVRDKTMAEDGYGELSKVIKTSKCPQLLLTNCNLNKEKLTSFYDGCRLQDVQVEGHRLPDENYMIMFDVNE